MTDTPENDESDDDESGWDGEYNSGPFCRHWSDPSDCEEVCLCDHRCGRHESDADDGACLDCDCSQWRERP